MYGQAHGNHRRRGNKKRGCIIHSKVETVDVIRPLDCIRATKLTEQGLEFARNTQCIT